MNYEELKQHYIKNMIEMTGVEPPIVPDDLSEYYELYKCWCCNQVKMFDELHLCCDCTFKVCYECEDKYRYFLEAPRCCDCWQKDLMKKERKHYENNKCKKCGMIVNGNYVYCYKCNMTNKKMSLE